MAFYHTLTNNACFISLNNGVCCCNNIKFNLEIQQSSLGYYAFLKDIWVG